MTKVYCQLSLLSCMMDVNSENGRNSAVVSSDILSQSISTISPTIENLNVHKSSRIHIGPKFVSVTQNVHNVEVIKGRFLCIQLESAKHPGRLSCGVAVFVCWSLIVVSALIVYVVYVALPKPTRLHLDLKEDWYLRREEWQAMPAYSVSFLQLPLKYVIIGHSAGNYCNQRYKCIEQMLVIQQDHLRRDFEDIGPNFLVGGNGFIFEGRGANVFPAMVVSWNSKSMTIMFMGNYVNDIPDEAQFDHVNILLETLVHQNVLSPDYILYGHCQVQPLTVHPGPEIMKRLHHFKHWDPVNATINCLSGK